MGSQVIRPDAPRATDAATTAGVPVAPSLGGSVGDLRLPQAGEAPPGRLLAVCALACGVGGAASIIAQLLGRLIALATNVSFYGRLSTEAVSPAQNHLGAGVILVPVLGGLIVGLMARFGTRAIRGHGIPEAMEQVLFNQSRIPKRVTFWKPISAAVAIGTGGPFGAEGPIIATGGALGSLVGQLLPVNHEERKVLLAAGAAAGMAATFGTPVSAVLLAIELLLFEYRPRSLLPVALAAGVATALRIAFLPGGAGPAFSMPALNVMPSGSALAAYLVLGVVVGAVSAWVTRTVYAVEDGFDKLPIHWMWWPALGGVVVGVVGLLVPRTLGVGYDNIEALLGGALPVSTIALLSGAKLVSWLFALGSGTSGGTLAPLLTIGGGLGAVLTSLGAMVLPHAGLDPRVGALVGMAALFAGASRALLASVVFAFEATRQPLGLLPLLEGCAAAYLVSSLIMRNSIMTEKIARRGARVPTDYGVDQLTRVLVREVALRAVTTLRAGDTVAAAQAWLASGAAEAGHQGFPLVDDDGLLVGVLTRRDLVGVPATPEATLATLIKRPPAVVFDDHTLRDAADHMVREGIGRLPVVARDAPRRVIGIVTRSDLLVAHRARLGVAPPKTAAQAA